MSGTSIIANFCMSLSSLLSVDAADITGLMSDKVKCYVGKLSVTHILLSTKLSGKLGHIPLGDRTKNAHEQYICLVVSQQHN